MFVKNAKNGQATINLLGIELQQKSSTFFLRQPQTITTITYHLPQTIVCGSPTCRFGADEQESGLPKAPRH
jgi:hypothetical protein